MVWSELLHLINDEGLTIEMLALQSFYSGNLTPTNFLIPVIFSFFTPPPTLETKVSFLSMLLRVRFPWLNFIRELMCYRFTFLPPEVFLQFAQKAKLVKSQLDLKTVDTESHFIGVLC